MGRVKYRFAHGPAIKDLDSLQVICLPGSYVAFYRIDGGGADIRKPFTIAPILR